MKFISNSPDETKEIGYRLGKLLKQGDIVGLYGELGAGKTTMVKGIAHALGLKEREIMSASFMVISEYNTKPTFYHIDLYRIESKEELNSIGLWEYFGGEGISVIEWAEKVEEYLPDEIIKVTFKSINEHEREITIEGLHEKSWNYQ